MGWQSLAEHAIDQLHLAGIREIHLVTSDGPVQLRRLLGAGDRWGLVLHWHVTDSASHPYRILRHLDLRQTASVLMGHADRFVAAPLLRSLWMHRGVLRLESQQAAVAWSGWACLPTEVVRGLGSQAPWPSLCDSMLALHSFFPAQCSEGLRDGDLLVVDEPDLYLQAQRRWMLAGWLERAPLSWIRHAWGLQHPGAKVEAGDDWVGPVVVGPGCVVQTGARLTGLVTLSRDVWLGSAAEVEDSVVLERSFISAGLTLKRCVINGTRLWRDGVSVELVNSDAILTQLSSGMPVTRLFERAVGQLCAWCLLLVAMPFWVPAWVWLGLTGRAVGGQQALPASVRGWLQVALGRKAWWGIRDRSQAQFDQLPDAWRRDLQRGRVGLWHQAANEGGPGLALPEQEAAADLFWMVQMRESLLRLCLYRLGLLRRLWLSRFRVLRTSKRLGRESLANDRLTGND